MAAWRAVVRVLRSPLDTISCALLPSRCRICDGPLLEFSTTPVCQHCWGQLRPQAGALCVLCGEALGPMAPFRRMENAASGVLCEQCQHLRPAFVQAAAYGAYDNTLRALVHLLKYEQVTALARPLGVLLAQAIQAMPNLPQEMTVVAVPLYPAKERQRGFNQTALLAEQAMHALRRMGTARRFHPALRALGRQRATEGQFGLTPHQRRRNLRGAFFAAQPEAVRGRAVLLLDDIYTTGATARECTRTLLAAGAASVHVATLARSQREGVALWDAPTASAAQRAETAQ